MQLNSNTIVELSDENEASNLSVTELRFDNKDIVSVEAGVFNRYKSLQELYLSGNKISELPAGVFHALTELRVVNLFNNEISSFNPQMFKENTKLEVINLGRNRINELKEEELFQNLPELKKLYFNNNRITTFNFRSLKDSTKLALLWFHHNNLREIKELANFKRLFPKLKFCGVENNNFSCSYMQKAVESLELQGIEIWYMDKRAGILADSVYGLKCVPDDVYFYSSNEGRVLECKVSDTEMNLKQLMNDGIAKHRVELINCKREIDGLKAALFVLNKHQIPNFNKDLKKEIKRLEDKNIKLEAAIVVNQKQSLQLAKDLKDAKEEMCRVTHELQQQQVRSEAELKALREEREEETVSLESGGRNLKALFTFINRKVDGQIINYNKEMEKLGAENIKLRDELNDNNRKLEEALTRMSNMQQEPERSDERQPYAVQKDIEGLKMDIRNTATTTTLIHGEVVKLSESNVKLSTEFNRLRCDFDQLSDKKKQNKHTNENVVGPATTTMVQQKNIIPVSRKRPPFELNLDHLFE